MTSWLNKQPIRGVWLLLLSYIGGIQLSAAIPTAHQHFNQPAVLVTALLVLLILTTTIRRHSLWPIILLLGVAVGFTNYAVTIRPPSQTTNLDHYINNKKVTISATVLEIEPQQGRWRMDVALKQITFNNQSSLATGKLRVQVGRHPKKGETLEQRRHDILPGDQIIFRAKLRKPRRYGLPGEFDYPRHLARLQIYVTAFIDNQQSIVHLPQAPQASTVPALQRWRIHLGDQISALFSPQQSAYLLSLTLGQKSRFSTTQRQQIAFLGISHLFSISGFHLSLIAGMIYLIVNTLYRQNERLMLHLPAQVAVPLLTLPPLIFYLLLSGSALPTMRAALLIIATTAALISQRSTPPLTLLAVVATIILAFDPLAIFAASFQLSFIGVAALIYCFSQLKEHNNSRFKKWFLTPLIATVIATIATTPIALWHFNTFAPASILCNMIAIPLIGILTVPLALSATLMFPLLPQFSERLFALSLWLINTTLQVSNKIAQGPFEGDFIYLSPTQHTLVALSAVVIIALMVKRFRFCVYCICFSFAVLLTSASSPAPAPLEVTALSVGQGESIVLRLGCEKTYLIDGGGFYSRSFDVGKQLLAPALAHMGISRFDAVILSHDHPDHRKGLIHILKTFNVEQFWCSIPPENLHWSLQKVLRDKQIPIRLFPPHWTQIALNGTTHLDIFVPPDTTAKMNDRSLVVFARHKEDGILLTGDLESYGVTQLLDNSLLFPVTALKLPHHGSRRSRPQALVQATKPSLAIASVGFNNSYHFPHPETVAALNNTHTALIRTDLDGTVRLKSFGNGWSQQTLAHPVH